MSDADCGDVNIFVSDGLGRPVYRLINPLLTLLDQDYSRLLTDGIQPQQTPFVASCDTSIAVGLLIQAHRCL